MMLTLHFAFRGACSSIGHYGAAPPLMDLVRAESNLTNGKFIVNKSISQYLLSLLFLVGVTDDNKCLYMRV